MNKLEQLNPMQRKAVLASEGPVLVLAGAGTGKTRVVTHRIAWLIEEKGVNPWNILAITFTNKAAGEMRERVNQLVDFGAESIWISTFHSACVRILRRHIQEIGFDTNFSIYDTDDQKTVMRQLLKRMDYDTQIYREKAMLSCISAAKNEMISPDEFAARAAGDYRESRIAEVYRAYQEELRKNNALDFDDLLVKTVELLKGDQDVREYYQNRFRYIMVDEYQDINKVQFEMVRLLAGKYRNLCVVGDDDQSIYRFRGADIHNILEFEQEFPGAEVLKLEQNYRSTGYILKAANNVISYNEGRKDKTLWTNNKKGEKIRLRIFNNGMEEARWVAETIAAARDRGVSGRNFAVLYRTNAQSRLLEEQFIYRGLPYRLVGGVNFYQRKEIKDILAYLKIIDNGVDDLAVQRVINVPRRGIGSKTIMRAADFARSAGISFYDALKRGKEIPEIGKAGVKVNAFVQQMEELKEEARAISVAELIDLILQWTGYEADLQNGDEAEYRSRLENIQELKNKAMEFTGAAAGEDGQLYHFLEEVALVADVDQMDEDEDKVLLMTLHSAKGLEFPDVYITGLEEGLFPGNIALSSDDESELEEERRLAYVGITRAMERLTLTCARQRMINGETRWYGQSRFINEIGAELIDQGEESEKNENAAAMPAAQRYCSDSTSKAVFGADSYTRSIGKEFIVKKSDSLPYGKGDRVHHVKYGDGTVIAVEDGSKDYEVTVIFDRVGQKKMFASFAKLKKM